MLRPNSISSIRAIKASACFTLLAVYSISAFSQNRLSGATCGTDKRGKVSDNPKTQSQTREPAFKDFSRSGLLTAQGAGVL
ncbi:MAG: hypothetical protein ACYCSP_14375 [Acidobacteriaceae bacterium]